MYCLEHLKTWGGGGGHLYLTKKITLNLQWPPKHTIVTFCQATCITITIIV